MSPAGQQAQDIQEKAVGYFCDRPGNFPTGRALNCCESVLLALSEPLGITSDLIPRIGTALGAGVSVNGLLCGSLSSVMILIGAMHGRTRPDESPQPAWQMGDKYVAAFRERFGAVNCRQLTGLDLKTEEGLKQYFARVHDHECTERIRFAVQKALDILRE